MVTQAFKDKWLESLTNGKNKRSRYSLSSDGNAETCVMGVARIVAADLNILPKAEIKGRHYLEDEELKAIGLNQDIQFHLASLNDTYIASDGKYPMRVINAIRALPVREPVLIEKK